MSDQKKPPGSMTERALALITPDGLEGLDHLVPANDWFRISRMEAVRKDDGRIAIRWLAAELTDKAGSYLLIDAVSRRAVCTKIAGKLMPLPGRSCLQGQRYLLIPLGLA